MRRLSLGRRGMHPRPGRFIVSEHAPSPALLLGSLCFSFDG